MSGGSYDYLCWNIDNLSGYRHQIEQMAVRLEGLPYAAAAAGQTRRVLRLLDAAEAVSHSLEDVWHAVEWRDSGDYGEETMAREIQAYQSPAIDASEGDAQAPNPAVLYRLVDVGAGRYELRPTVDTGHSDHEGSQGC